MPPETVWSVKSLVFGVVHRTVEQLACEFDLQSSGFLFAPLNRPNWKHPSFVVERRLFHRHEQLFLNPRNISEPRGICWWSWVVGEIGLQGIRYRFILWFQVFGLPQILLWRDLYQKLPNIRLFTLQSFLQSQRSRTVWSDALQSCLGVWVYSFLYCLNSAFCCCACGDCWSSKRAAFCCWLQPVLSQRVEAVNHPWSRLNSRNWLQHAIAKNI